MTLNANAALSTQARGSIQFPAALDGDRTLTLNSQQVLFGGTIGQVTPLASLTVNARNTEVSGNITAVGDIALNSTFNLRRNVTISATTGNITLANIDSALDTANNLTVLAGGNITFRNAIGQTQGLGLLSANATAVTVNAPITARNLRVNAVDSLVIRGGTANTSGADTWI